MAWSYSALKAFETCARQYHEMSVLKNYPWEEGEQQLYGREMHKAAENYINRRTPLPKQFAYMQDVLDTLLKKKGIKLAEQKLAMNHKLEPCKWMAKDVWVRAVVDFLILNEEDGIAWAVDWKTGNSKYADKDQLDVMSLAIFEHYPAIQTVKSALVFVISDGFIKHNRARMETEPLWWDYRNRVAKIDKAHTSGVWNPSQSGLCKKHCAVTSCEFNGRS
jgi:hypothetical protein